MACATWLHSSQLSRALLPIRRLRTSLLPSKLRRFNRFTSTSTTRLITSSSPFKRPLMAVNVQAKRGFSIKEDEVASPADLYFEAPLSIVEYPDPLLRAKNKRIDSFDENLKRLVDEMFDVMYK
ncbi:unnamed protein product [Ilex paraguariensis]|uniref:peptide deformylase n=1 Tax=Ilex paraguariensis TaxID=185542 RepID=A0ABC8U914_9AQUA